MATRTVSIKVMLDGYSQYKNTVSNLNAQNRLLEAQLKELDLIYGKNSTEVEVLAKKQELWGKQLAVQTDKLRETDRMLQQAYEKQEQYKKALDQTGAAMQTAQKNLDDFVKGTYEGTESQEELKEALGKATLEYNTAQKNYTTITNEIARLTNERNNEIKAIKDTNDKLQEEAQERSKFSEVMKAMGENLKEYANQAELAKNALSGVQQAISDSVNAAIEYESSFAGVRKTVDETKIDLDKLSDSIKEMSTQLPYTTTEINKIAEIAGQLGVDSSADEIKQFTEVVLGLGAATNITAEDAATLLAQFKNINDFTQKDGVGGYEKFASVIVELGNNTATTESEIMAMAQRFSSAGTLAGLSAPEILGMSAALASVGVKAEAGGTSLTKLTQRIQGAVETNSEDLELFAEIAGTTAEEFASTWSTSPVEAIELFIGGLHETYEEGDSVLQLLEDIEFNEVRLRNATMSLAAGEKNLSYYVDMANKAWKENSALQTEVSKRYDTTESKQKMLRNSIDLMKIEIGEALLPVIAKAMTSIRDVVIPITEWIDKNPILVKTIASLIGMLIGLSTAVTTVNNVVTGMSAIISFVSNPISAAVLGMSLLVVAIVGVVEAISKLTRGTKEYIGNAEVFASTALATKDVINDSTRAYAEQTQAIDETDAKAQEYLDKLKDIEKDGKVTKDEQEEYNDTIAELKKLLPELNIEIDKKTGKIKGGTDALKEQIDAWKENAKAEAAASRLKTMYEQLYNVQDELRENIRLLKSDQRQLAKTEEDLAKAKEEYAKLMGRNIPLTTEERKRKAELEKTISDLTGKQDELNQAIADHEEGMRTSRQAIEDTETAIVNFQNSIEGVTEVTKEDIEVMKGGKKAVKEYGESFDMTELAKQYGGYAAAAYAQGWRTESYKITDEVKKALNVLNTKIKVNTPAGVISTRVEYLAEGGIVNRPTPAIIGEAGTEAVIPIEKLYGFIDYTLTKYNDNMLNRNTSPKNNANYTMNVYTQDMTPAQQAQLFNRFNMWIGSNTGREII